MTGRDKLKPNSTPELPEIVDDINRLADQVRILLPQMGVETQVEVGQKLWVMSRKLTAVLEEVKIHLRDEALKQQNSTSEVICFNSPDGSRCKVRFPTPCLEIRKGADMSAVRNLLGDQFPTYFKTTVTYKPQNDFRDTIEEISDPSIRQTVLDAVDVIPATPKVFFED